MKKLLSILLIAATCGSVTSCKLSGISYLPPGHIGFRVGDPGDQSHYSSPKQP